MAVENGGGGGGPTSPVITYASYIRPSGGATQTGGTGSRAAARQKRKAKQQAKTVTDSSGTNLSSNDESGFGLNRPYHLWATYATNLETNPTATPAFSTTSGTFGALVTCSSEPQHPVLRVRCRVVNGAATSGEVRLVDRATGTVISSVQSIGSGATLEFDLDGTLVAPTLAGAGAPMRVDVQARRTAGANTVALLVMHALGKGT